MKFIQSVISRDIYVSLLEKKHVITAISATMLLLGSYSAQAQIASVSAAVNLRQGPGTGYARIAALPRGVNVHINTCRGGWCQIRSSWGVGWVSGRYLLRGYAGSHYAPNYAPNYAPAYGSDYSGSQSQVILGLNIGSGYSDDDYYSPYYRPNYRPFYRPNYRPNFGPGYRPIFGPGYRPDGPRYFPRPGGREGWNPRWGLGPVYFPRGGWHR